MKFERNQKTWLHLCLAFLFGGCASISIHSNPPEATVELRVPGVDAPKNLGKTPFETNISQLENVINNGPIVISVSKPGYISQNFVVPNLVNGKLKLDTTLTPNLPSNYAEVNRIVSLSFQAERFILEKRFDEALKVAESIKNLNENVASAFHIEGTVFYLKNELEKAKFAWIRSLELEPNNAEAKGVLQQIEKKLGIEKPSAPVGQSPK